MSNPDNKRRRVLIDRDFQLRFILRFSGLLVFYFLLFMIISVVAPVGLSLLDSNAEGFMLETAWRVDVLLRLVLAPLFCTFLCLLAHGVLETFRIAGPNHRFRMTCLKLKQLIVPRGMRVRQGDYLQETAKAMSEALEALHDKMLQVRSESRAALAAIQAAGGQGQEVPASVVQAIHRVDESLREVQLVTTAPACEPLEEEGGDSVSPESLGVQPVESPQASSTEGKPEHASQL